MRGLRDVILTCRLKIKREKAHGKHGNVLKAHGKHGAFGEGKMDGKGIGGAVTLTNEPYKRRNIYRPKTD